MLANFLICIHTKSKINAIWFSLTVEAVNFICASLEKFHLVKVQWFVLYLAQNLSFGNNYTKRWLLTWN